MDAFKATLENAGFNKALRQYCDLKKNVEPKKELRRRAKNVSIRLIKIYQKGGVDLEDITLFRIGDNIKIRPKIWAKNKANPKKWTYKRMIAAELRARRSAKGYTATGWFPSLVKLGGSPKDRKRSGPIRGKLIERLATGSEISETLVNQQPGSAHVHDKVKTGEQQALDAETADMVKYIDRKLREAAKKNGL